MKQRRLQPARIRGSDAMKTRFLIIVNRFAEDPGCRCSSGNAGSATAWWSQPKQVPRGSTCWCRLYFEHTVLLAAPWLPPMASSALAWHRFRGLASLALVSGGHGCLSCRLKGAVDSVGERGSLGGADAYQAEVGLNPGVYQACAPQVVKSRPFLERTVCSNVGPGYVVLLNRKFSGAATGFASVVTAGHGDPKLTGALGEAAGFLSMD